MESWKEWVKFAVIIVCAIALDYASQVYEKHCISRADAAATAIYQQFCTYDFDGIEADMPADSVMLYEYVSSKEASSVLERKTVANVRLTDNEMKHFHQFKNVESICTGGLFFAASVTFDGEWTGICIPDSKVPLHLQKYIVQEVTQGHYWLEVVPNHMLCDYICRKQS